MSSGSGAFADRMRDAIADEYEIEGQIGRGGMATVFVATDRQLRRKVAIKVMSPELGDVAGIQNRFVIEARTAAYLDHPNVITVYSVREVDDLLLIVMKYVDGRTIGELSGDGAPVEVDVAASILVKVADALHYAHGEGIVHRDIKPSNIMIDRRGRPIVTDFGIAKLAPGAPTRIATVEAGTIPGTMLGTAAYMSPEQCRGETAAPASDQYSLGVTAYELFSGSPPFHGPMLGLIEAHKSQTPPPLRERNPDLDPDVEETVMRMLAKDPADRWPSLDDVKRRMEDHAVSARGGRAAHEVQRRIAELATPGRVAPTVTTERTASTPSPNLAVVPGEPRIEVGEELRLELRNPGTGSLGLAAVEWRSEDVEVAEVDEVGRVTGRAPGVAKITAKTAKGVGRATVTVQPAEVRSVVVTPPGGVLEVGEETRFVADALDARGDRLFEAEIEWSSSAPSVCGVSEDGRVSARSPGRASIVARCDDVSGTAEIDVRSAEAPAGVAGGGGEGEPGSWDDRVVVDGEEVGSAGSPVGTGPAQPTPPPGATRIPGGQAGAGEPDADAGRGPAPGAALRRPGALATAGFVVLLLGLGVWLVPWGGLGTEGADDIAAPAAVSAGNGEAPSTAVDGAGGASTGADVPERVAGEPSTEESADGAAQAQVGADGAAPAEVDDLGTAAGPTDLSVEDPARAGGAPEPAAEEPTTDPTPPEPREEPVLVAADDPDPGADARDPSAAGVGGDGAGPTALPSDSPTPGAAPPEDDDPGRADPPVAADAGGVDLDEDLPATPDEADPSTADDAPDDADDDAPARFCDDASVPARALAAALDPDPAGRLDDLYVPSDAEDERTKADLLDTVRGTNSLTVANRPVRPEPAAGGCDWIVTLDFRWTNAFGQPRSRSVEVRVELAEEAGTARVSRLFGAQ